MLDPGFNWFELYQVLSQVEKRPPKFEQVKKISVHRIRGSHKGEYKFGLHPKFKHLYSGIEIKFD